MISWNNYLVFIRLAKQRIVDHCKLQFYSPRDIIKYKIQLVSLSFHDSHILVRTLRINSE